MREKSGNFEVNDKWQPCIKVNGYTFGGSKSTILPSITVSVNS